MKVGYIYKIVSPTNRIYIGQTDNIKRRTSQYKALRTKKQPLLHASLLSHGWDNHKFEVIETIFCDEYEFKKLLNEREIYYINIYKSNKNKYKDKKGLNLTDGGDGSRGFKHSALSRLSNAKEIECYNTDCTLYIKFPSIIDGEKYFSNNKSKWNGHISQAIKEKTFAYGKIWKFTNDDLSAVYEIVKNMKKRKEERCIPSARIPVMAFNPDKTLYKEFESISIAAKDLETRSGDIIAAIKTKNRCMNKFWLRKKDIDNLDEIKLDWKIQLKELPIDEQRKINNERKRLDWHKRKLQKM